MASSRVVPHAQAAHASGLRVGVSSGMRGYYACLFDDDGPVQSGIGSYRCSEGAHQEATDWAEAEGLPLVPLRPILGTERRSTSVPTNPTATPYTGIGSRETPEAILTLMTSVARRLAERGYRLRSGAAPGADSAFEAGAGLLREIFLPWDGFNSRHASEPGVYVTSELACAKDAEALAAAHHPGWNRLGQGARKLHTRNATQLLGRTLDAPSAFVICWAPNPLLEDGKVINVDGGTGLAVRLAVSRQVPIFHLGIDEHRARIERWLACVDAASGAAT